MMRLSLTFSSLLCVALTGVFCGMSRAATVTGSIDITRAPQGSHPSDESASDIVVWLSPVPPTSDAIVQPQHAQLLQKDKMFHPHTLVITAGSTVDFPNADPIFHNAFSNYDGQLFDVGLYPPGTSRSVHFRRPGIVRVFCNIHPSMFAVIVVLDTPYFTKANRDGHYRLTNVPAGTYRLHVFDERATSGQDSQGLITIDASEAALSAPMIHLSEAGYVQAPHKNKYGLDYPPTSTEAETYTGLAK